MKTILTTILLAFTLSAAAQTTDADRWKLVEKAGKQKQAAILTALASGAIAAVAYQGTGEVAPALGIAAAGVTVSIALNLGSARSLKRAGR